MRKHIASIAGLLLVALFVVVFLSGRREAKPLDLVAGQLGLRSDDLAAMVPRISSQSGATTGTSRRLVYLMACSGATTGATLEAQATLAATVAEQRGMTPREAATAVLADMSPDGRATAQLSSC